MRNWFRIPLLFLTIGALIGTTLRYHFVFPIGSLHFMNWMHAHSHVMFLGWITNLLMLAFIHQFIPDKWSSFKWLFIGIQIILAGLTLSFILQGYGVLSIVFLSAHSFLMYVFCILFLRRTRDVRDEAIPFIRAALLFFFISTWGAFSLGPIAANGLGQSKWYYYAIFLYLHFQYNGFFVFGIAGLFFRALKNKGIGFSPERVKRFRLLLFYSCFPAYFLSVIWSDPGPWIVAVAALAGVVQIWALTVFIQLLRTQWSTILDALSRPMKILVGASFVSFVIKSLLQLASAAPVVGDLASDVRFFVLAYLHLVLIGMISFYLLFWLTERRIIRDYHPALVSILMAGFILSEAVMIATPLYGAMFQIFTIVLLICSGAMTAVFIAPLFSFSSDL